MIERKSSLPEYLILFFRFLRDKGFSIGPDLTADSMAAILKMDALRNQDLLRMTLKASLVKNLKQSAQFDEYFEEFFRELEKAVDSKVVENQEDGVQSKTKQNGPSLNALKDWLFQHENQDQEEEAIAQFSAAESMAAKDFSAYSDHEQDELTQVIRKLSRQLSRQQSRRWTSTHHHQKLDIRKTIRQNLRTGTEIMDLCYQERKTDKLKIVLLCDVSRSMDLYSRFLIQFLYGFQQLFLKIESFVFSTKLYRITHELRFREFEEALQNIQDSVPAWSGGTRIGESLNHFVQSYGSRMIDDKTVVLILSDGWDTGEMDQLEQAMKQLKRRSARVIWLNPLAGHPNFKPEVQGMAVAWPYIDVFAPAHNLESLKAILPLLRLDRSVKQFGSQKA